jgi:hypothetical protein
LGEYKDMNSFKLLLSAAKLADLNHAFGLVFGLILLKFRPIAPLLPQILALSEPNHTFFRLKTKSLNEFYINTILFYKFQDKRVIGWRFL